MPPCLCSQSGSAGHALPCEHQMIWIQCKDGMNSHLGNCNFMSAQDFQAFGGDRDPFQKESRVLHPPDKKRTFRLSTVHSITENFQKPPSQAPSCHPWADGLQGSVLMSIIQSKLQICDRIFFFLLHTFLTYFGQDPLASLLSPGGQGLVFPLFQPMLNSMPGPVQVPGNYLLN